MKSPFLSVKQFLTRDPLKPVARDKSIRGERDLRYLFFFFAQKKENEGKLPRSLRHSVNLARRNVTSPRYFLEGRFARIDN